MDFDTKSGLPPLSPRMQLIASMVTNGSRLADIGCDHAYLSIFLAKTGTCPICIAADVNKKPLIAASENISLYDCSDKVTTRLSNGLEAFSPNEVDCIMICGMGGRLMQMILSERPDIIKTAKELVLEPQSDTTTLRRFLYENGFEIKDEAFVTEQMKYYPIIKAVPTSDAKAISDIEYEYGPILLRDCHPLLYEHLQKQHSRFSAVLNSLSAEQTDARSEIHRKLECVLSAMSYYPDHTDNS